MPYQHDLELSSRSLLTTALRVVTCQSEDAKRKALRDLQYRCDCASFRKLTRADVQAELRRLADDAVALAMSEYDTSTDYVPPTELVTKVL